MLHATYAKCHEEVSCLPADWQRWEIKCHGIKSLISSNIVIWQGKIQVLRLHRPIKHYLQPFFQYAMDSPLSIFGGDARYALVKAILRGAESLLGKIQWFMVGLREAEKPPAKSYELFWAQNAFSLKTVGPLEPFCSLLNCFYAVGNVNLCFCSHEILPAPFFSLLAQSKDGLGALENKVQEPFTPRENCVWASNCGFYQPAAISVISCVIHNKACSEDYS